MVDYDRDMEAPEPSYRGDKRPGSFGPHEFSHKLSPNAMRDRERENEASDARIQAQLGYMTERLMIIQKTFSELQNRLDPILIPDIEDDRAEVASPPRKMASEMSNTIDDLNDQISRLQNRMERVLQRIQL